MSPDSTPTLTDAGVLARCHAECPVLGCDWRSDSWTTNTERREALRPWFEHRDTHFPTFGPHFVKEDPTT
jgi:hypothetical protein